MIQGVFKQALPEALDFTERKLVRLSGTNTIVLTTGHCVSVSTFCGVVVSNSEKYPVGLYMDNWSRHGVEEVKGEVTIVTISSNDKVQV